MNEHISERMFSSRSVVRNQNEKHKNLEEERKELRQEKKNNKLAYLRK